MADETRRNFLKLGCTAVASATIASGLNFINVKEAKAATPGYGYPVGGLNVDNSADLGYQGYKGTSPYSADAGKHCAAATFGAILGQMQDVVGGSYDNIPLGMMEWASGGVASFGSLCGTLNGAAAAIGVICDNDDAKGFINDLLTWYSETNLPIYAPEGAVAHTQSIAGSNLCHISVTNWCIASGNASGSSERSDRCACLSADVVAKVVEMLNANVGGIMGNPRDNSTVCGACHYKGTDSAGGQFTRGKMNCESCHTKITKAPERGHHGGKNK
jgi:hypothetical protein